LRIGDLFLKKSLKGFIKLTRFNEYHYFVIVTTLLGVAAAKGTMDWRLFVLLPANWLAVGFAFMFNDVEDAPDDALSTNKINRNPISAGLITPKTAKKSAVLVGLISAGLFALLGQWPFILGLISLILGYLYSVRGVRLKTFPFLDLYFHSLMLAGLQFLCGYFTFASQLSSTGLWPFLFVISISMYVELHNEIRDIESDRAVYLRQTAIGLGEKNTQILMLILLIIGAFSGAVSLFLIDLIPLWVVLTMMILLGIFSLPTLLKITHEEGSMAILIALHKPLEQAAALALVLQYVLPWLDQVWNLGLF
jgi:4-hydroxybenzoate polyprenyltransferase